MNKDEMAATLAQRASQFSVLHVVEYVIPPSGELHFRVVYDAENPEAAASRVQNDTPGAVVLHVRTDRIKHIEKKFIPKGWEK